MFTTFFTLLFTYCFLLYTYIKDYFFGYFYNCKIEDNRLVINYYVNGKKFILYKKFRPHSFGDNCIHAALNTNGQTYNFTDKFNEINGYNNCHNVVEELCGVEIVKLCLPEIYNSKNFFNSTLSFMFEDGEKYEDAL